MDIATIWASPKRGIAPDISPLVGAADMEALMEASAPLWDAYGAGLEAEYEGEGFADCRPSLFERILDIWDGVVDRLAFWRHRTEVQSAARPFVFQLPLGTTRPTWELSFDYDAMDAETARFRGALAAQITGDRGAPFRVIVAPERMDDALEEDGDITGFAHTLDGITQYWPPKGDQPALALYEMQEDGGLPIEVALIAHPVEAHQNMVARLERDFGGRLEPIV